MGNVVREGVEGIGISPSMPTLSNKSWFTEVAIPEIVKIPDVKPDMEELLSVMVDAKIVSLRIIETPKGTSNEGQMLTRRKLSIELLLKQKVKYIADEPTQSVHAAHFENTVSSIWVVIPETVKIKGEDVKLETLLMQGKLVATPYIEDIYGVQLDKRTIFKNITVLIHVTVPCAEAKLTLTKSDNCTNHQIIPTGSFTYSILLHNSGNVDANHVIFKDAVPPANASYVSGSFKINGISPTSAPTATDITNGVDIGTIPAGGSTTITFICNVTGADGDTIKNSASATYEFRIDSELTKTSTSNSTTINIEA